MANFPASIPSFTTKNDGPGNKINAAHMNAVQDEIVQIGTDLISGLRRPLRLEDATEFTLASGAITVTRGYCKVDTEADAASDDLDTITPGSNVGAGSILALRAEDVTRVVTVKDGTGNILLNGGDVALDATDKIVILLYDGTNWRGGLLGAIPLSATKNFINDTANADMTVGLTINQGAADDQALALKSSDVAHGVTTLAETDTYGAFQKTSAAQGGLTITSLGDTDDNDHMQLRAVVNLTGTGKSTAATGGVNVVAAKPNGTGVTDQGANSNLLSVRNNATTRFILDADGDSHQDVGTAWTNFDDGDDIARLDAIAVALAREGDPLRGAFVRHFEEQRAVIEAMPGKPLVTFNADGHHFVNMSRLTMLLTGAVRQLARANQELAARLARTERRLVEGQ